MDWYIYNELKKEELKQDIKTLIEKAKDLNISEEELLELIQEEL